MKDPNITILDYLDAGTHKEISATLLASETLKTLKLEFSSL